MSTYPSRIGKLALAIAIAFASASSLSGCDQSSRLSADEHIERAKDFQSKGNTPSSILELKNAVQKDPNNAQARWLLGTIYLDMRLGSEAEFQLNKAVELGISPSNVRIPLARAQLYQGNFQKILDTLAAAESEEPRVLAQILDLRGSALLGLDKYNDGCTLFERAIGMDKAYAPSYLGRARCQYKDGNTASALESANHAAKINPEYLSTFFLLGDLHRALNQIDEALASYDRALALKPDDYDALASKAMTLLSVQRDKEAEDVVSRLGKLRPQAPQTNYLSAYLKHRQGNDKEAANLLQLALREAPNSPQINLLYGTVNYALKNDQIALSSLQKSLGSLDLPEARILLAATQLRMGTPADAVKTLEPLLKTGGNSKAFLLAGQALLEQGEVESGLSLLEQASRVAPKETVIRTALAQNQLLTGDQRGITGLESVITDNPKESQAYLLLAANQVSKSDFGGALETLRKMAAAQPTNPLSHVLIGRVSLLQKNPKAARQAFERALVIDPGFLPAAAALADLDIREKKPAEARERFKRILAKSPDNLGALLGQARTAETLGDTNEYVAILKKAIETHPNSPMPVALLTRHYIQRTKQPESALDLAQRAAGANAGNPAFLDNLGEAQLAAKRTKDAVDTYTRLANAQPNSAAAWYRLAWAQRVSGNPDGALKSLQRALQIEPDHLDARIALAGVYVVLNQPDKALQETRAIQQRAPNSTAGYNLEAELAARLNQPEVVLQALSRAFTNIPSSDTAATYHLALLRAGKTAQAEQVAAQWLKRSRRTHRSASISRRPISANSRSSSAIVQYQQVVKDHPEHVLALNNLASLLMERKDNAGYGFAQRAYALQPTNPVVMDTQAWALHLQGKTTEAVPLLKQAAGALPEMPAVQYHWGAVLADNGRHRPGTIGAAEGARLEAAVQRTRGRYGTTEIPAELRPRLAGYATRAGRLWSGRTWVDQLRQNRVEATAAQPSYGCHPTPSAK
jgi:putative PEP-CTERM system TPR-repeat lipoprotein